MRPPSHYNPPPMFGLRTVHGPTRYYMGGDGILAGALIAVSSLRAGPETEWRCAPIDIEGSLVCWGAKFVTDHDGP